MIETRAPGKLFIVGEYAVVESGEPAVLVAVNRYLQVRLSESQTPLETASEHLSAAISVVHELCEARGVAQRFFTIETDSELEDDTGRKHGLGSSAAVTVATIEALDHFYALGLSPLERMKLALLATIRISPRASGGDIAASTFGGWLFYRSPDRAALRAHHEAHGIVSALDCEAWDNLEVRHLNSPRELELLVGWTGSPASTQQLVDRVTPAMPTGRRNRPFEQFLAASRTCVEAFAHELQSSGTHAREQIHVARELLQELGEIESIAVETPLLKTLCDTAELYGAVAKPSGAGGGDCGIAFTKSGEGAPEILREWKQHGIRPLHLEVLEPLFSTEGGEDAT